MTTSFVSLQILACNFGTVVSCENLFCCLWCNKKKNSCSLCKKYLTQKEANCVLCWDIYNVVPRPLLQTVLVIRHYWAVVGMGGGEGKAKTLLRLFFFFVLLQDRDGLADLLQMPIKILQ